MAYQYTDTEDDVAARLTANMPTGYSAIVMPEKQNQYNIGSDKVLIIVAFNESNFEAADSIGHIVQKENVSIMVNVKSARLRGVFSINEALELVKIILVGFKPTNVSKLSLQKIEFDDRSVEDNYFSYNIIFKGTKLQVEVADEEVLPLLTKITINHPAGEQLFEINSTL